MRGSARGRISEPRGVRWELRVKGGRLESRPSVGAAAFQPPKARASKQNTERRPSAAQRSADLTVRSRVRRLILQVRAGDHGNHFVNPLRHHLLLIKDVLRDFGDFGLAELFRSGDQ